MTKLIAVMCVAAFACGKGKSDSAKADEGAKPAAAKTAEPPKPHTGAISVDDVIAADSTVTSLAPWDEALAKMQGKLGAPTKVDADKYVWGAATADDCAYIEVTQKDFKKEDQMGVEGKAVYTVSHPQKINKSDADGFATCTKAIAK